MNIKLNNKKISFTNSKNGICEYVNLAEKSIFYKLKKRMRFAIALNNR